MKKRARNCGLSSRTEKLFGQQSGLELCAMFAYIRSATRLASRVRHQSFTSAAGSKSRLRPLPIALGALAGSSLTAFYFMNAVDYHPAALSTEEELLHHDKAIKDVEELLIVKELRARDDVITREAYGHLKGAAKLHNLTATVSFVILKLGFFTDNSRSIRSGTHFFFFFF